jgi:hypothetical protein
MQNNAYAFCRNVAGHAASCTPTEDTRGFLQSPMLYPYTYYSGVFNDAERKSFDTLAYIDG